MKVVRSDLESAMVGDEMGIWLQRQGIRRFPQGKDQHSHLAEAHIRILRNTMHHLEEEAKQLGLELSISELATLANMAKNNIAEYGGFSPTQSLFGTAPMNCLLYTSDAADE